MKEWLTHLCLCISWKGHSGIKCPLSQLNISAVIVVTDKDKSNVVYFGFSWACQKQDYFTVYSTTLYFARGRFYCKFPFYRSEKLCYICFLVLTHASDDSPKITRGNKTRHKWDNWLQSFRYGMTSKSAIKI